VRAAKSKTMKYSVIIPTYNRASLLRMCLSSLLESSKTTNSYEIIVVDDDSSAHIQGLAREFNGKYGHVRYLKTPHVGPGRARNAGIEKARGEVIVFLDDDCTVNERWFLALEGIFANPKVEIAGGPLENPNDSYAAWCAHLLNFSSWLPRMSKRTVPDIPAANAAYRKHIIKSHFFKNFSHNEVYEDSLFNFELREKGHKISFFPELGVQHHAFESGEGLGKFFFQQERSARGFCKGGYAVHGIVGKILYSIPVLNLLCPRLLCVLWRCSLYGEFLRFVWCFPLLLAGEFYRGWIVCTIALRHAMRFDKTAPMIGQKSF
jgi:glycosyltransferase involved in cell wall biosynthesis